MQKQTRLLEEEEPQPRVKRIPSGKNFTDPYPNPKIRRVRESPGECQK